MSKVRASEIERAFGQPRSKPGRERRYSCPNCDGETEPTLVINVRDQVFYCYRCGAGRGKRLQDVFEFYGLQRPTQHTLWDFDDEEEEQKKRPKSIPKVHRDCFKPIPSGLISVARDPLAIAARNFLTEERGISPQVIQACRLGYGVDYWQGYVLFPIFEGVRREKMVYFSGRAMHRSTKPRQRNPPAEVFPFDASEVIHGHERAVMLGWGVLAEAPLDSYKIGPYAMATGGMYVSDEQKELLRSLPLRKLVIYFDREIRAQELAWQLALELVNAFPEGTYVAVPPGKDPGVCSYEANRLAIVGARRATEGAYIRAAANGYLLGLSRVG